nr:GNAT family protein [Halobacillus sp. A5]
MDVWNFWQGKRVRLRGVEPEDADVMFNWDGDSEAIQSVGSIPFPHSYKRLKEHVEALSKKEPESDHYSLIIESEEKEAIGMINTFDCDRRNGTFKYAILIARPYRGRGYAKEAVHLIMTYFFNELSYQKLTSIVYSFNKSSIQMHENMGFQKEGQLRNMIFTGGHYYDFLYFGITRDEFSEKEWV